MTEMKPAEPFHGEVLHDPWEIMVRRFSRVVSDSCRDESDTRFERNT